MAEILYPLLDNYSYQGKPTYLSALDILSLPVRKILGGKEVSIIDMASGNPPSKLARIAILVVSVALWPIALISSVFLILKKVVLTFSSELKSINDQLDANIKSIKSFDEHLAKNEISEARAIYERNPQIFITNRHNQVFKLANQMINNDFLWNEISPILSKLKQESSLKLINHAVKVKLRSTTLVNMEEVEDLIFESLSGDRLLRAYSELCKGALQLQNDDDLYMIYKKLVLAHDLISSLKSIPEKMGYPHEFFSHSSPDIELLKSSIFLKYDEPIVYMTLKENFNDNNKMAHIRTLLQNALTGRQDLENLRVALEQFLAASNA